MTQYTTTPSVGVTTAIVTPKDRIRWGPIWGGIFTALSTLIVLGVLGVAVGLSTWDAGADPNDVGVGTGIWAAISAIIAFFFGGWMAARMAAFRGRWSATVNGAMVWAVAVPLALLLGGGAALLGNGLLTGTQSMSRADYTIIQTNEAQQASATIGDTLTPQVVTEASDSATSAAWWTLISLLVGLCAAAFGGYLGHRDYDTDYDREDRGYATPPATT